MPSPQLENGWTRIANELLEALARADLNATQLRIMLVIMRESYGRQAKVCTLSYTRIAELVGQPRSVVGRNLKDLVRRKFLRHHDAVISQWSVQKDYAQWDGGSDQLVTSDQSVTSDQTVTTASDQLVTKTSDQLVTHIKKEKKYDVGAHEPLIETEDAYIRRELSDLGYSAKQIKVIAAANPGFDRAALDICKQWLATSTHGKPKGYLYRILEHGRLPQVEAPRQNGGPTETIWDNPDAMDAYLARMNQPVEPSRYR
jgi:phage replication O-like protein O